MLVTQPTVMLSRWKFLIAGAALLAFLLYAAVLASSLRQSGRQHLSASTSAKPTPSSGTNSSLTPVPTAQPEIAVVTPKTVVSIPPLPPDAVSVPDADLLRLSAMVDLPNAADHLPDKAGWQQAIVIADQLQQGPCDCEQRNWLKHFVETGNSALSSPAEYAENVQLMLKLARNDKQAMELSHKPN